MASDGFGGVRRMMDDFYAFRKLLGAQTRDIWMPPTDVYETPENVVIKMSVPGIKAATVRVMFNGNEIIISGHRSAVHDAPVVAYHQMEIRNGLFERRVVVHKPIDPDGATSEYTNGFLWVRVPKAAAFERRIVRIKLKG
jgi:HSP20 family protein